MARKVTLHGMRLWALDEPDSEQDYPLAPPEHCDADGNLIAWDQDSYAHVFETGEVKRYLRVIGTVADLLDGWNDEHASVGAVATPVEEPTLVPSRIEI
jgi:hypothetical protein